MMELDVAELMQELQAFADMAPEQIAFAAVFYGGQIAAALFAARTICILIGRQFGVVGPTLYAKFPRVPWRSLLKVFLRVKVFYERVFWLGRRSTGGFAGLLATLTLLFTPGKVFLGRASMHGVGLLQPVGLHVKRHITLMAMTGSSKTTSLTSMVSAWDSSAFLIDAKSQVVDALADRDWRTWHVFAPYAKHSACFNPFDVLKEAIEREGPQAAVRWAMRIAEALIVTPVGSRSPYFTDVARQFLAALILHVLTKHPESEHNLPYVRDLIINGYTVYDEFRSPISTPEEAQTLLIRAMLKNAAFEIIAGGAQALESASGETGGNVRSVLQEQTKWLDIPEIREKMRRSTFTLSELKTRNDIVVALSAPIFSIREELAPVSRLMVSLTAYTFESVKARNGLCLAVWDELPSLGFDENYIAVILAVLRSMGLVVVAVGQNVELMRKAFPHVWKSFFGEADATIWAGGNHQDSAEYLHRVLGRKTLVDTDPYSGRKSYREVDVMTTDQIRRFTHPDSGNVIVTRAGERPLQLKAPFYFKELPVWRYAPDPDHKEILLRRIFRFLFDRKVSARVDQAPAHPSDGADDAKDRVNQEASDLATNVVQFHKPHSGESS